MPGNVNIRKHLLAITISCALLGASASSASAAGEFFHSKYPNSAHAVQTATHIFRVDGQKAECKTVELNGASQNGRVKELTLTPTYKECTAFTFSGASITANGCTYQLTQPNGSKDGWEGGLVLKCPAGKKLKIESSVFGSTCKVEIGEQTPAGGVAYENDTGAKDLDLSFNLSAIKATKVTDNGSCPLSGTGESNNATYVGGSEVEAASGGSLTIGVYGPGQFLHSKYPNSVHAVQTETHKLIVDGQSVTCKTAELNGNTQIGPATELTLTPAYNECTAFGFAGASINPNGCTYRLTQPEGFADNWAGGFAIKCPAGKKLVIASSVFGSECKAEIGEQTPTGSVTYENDTVEGNVDLSFNLSAIKVTKVADNGLCPLSGTGETNTVTYTGGSSAEAASGWKLTVGVIELGRFQASGYSAKLGAAPVGEHVMNIDSLPLECESIVFASTDLNAASTTLRLYPSYYSCYLFGQKATVDMNECSYLLAQPSGEGASWTGTMTIDCPGSSKIEVFSANSQFGECEFTIEEQGPLGSVNYENNLPASGQITVDLFLDEIHANVTKDISNCLLGGTGERTDVSYDGESQLGELNGKAIFLGP